MHPEDHKRLLLVTHVTFWTLTVFEAAAVYHYITQRDVMTAGAMLAYLCKDGVTKFAERLG